MPLVLRGIAMGLTFTPLTALALADIPTRKMAQASGLFNVIRQIGGSFGVAILGTMLTRRMIFHLAMYGQSVDQHSPAFQNIVSGIQHFSQQSGGGTTALATMRAGALIGEHLAQQAFVRAVNDDFLIAAIISILGVLPILLLRAPKKRGSPARVAPME